MAAKLMEMTDAMANASKESARAFDEHQHMISSYKEKVGMQDTQIAEFKSEMARMKINLEDESKVTYMVDLFAFRFDIA